MLVGRTAVRVWQLHQLVLVGVVISVAIQFTDVNRTYQVGTVHIYRHVTAPVCGMAVGRRNWSLLCRHWWNLELIKCAGIYTSRTTVSSSRSVLLRTDCRSFVHFQPVKWSYQFPPRPAAVVICCLVHSSYLGKGHIAVAWDVCLRWQNIVWN